MTTAASTAWPGTRLSAARRPAMIQFVLVLLMAFSAGASAEDLPVPPIPPALPPVTEVAPVPNLDAEAPVAPSSNQTSLNMKFYKMKLYDPSSGFTPARNIKTPRSVSRCRPRGSASAFRSSRSSIEVRR